LARLELVDLLLAVAELFQIAIEFTLVRRALFATTDGLVQAWRATDEDLDLLALLGFGQNGLQELLGHQALAALPCLGRVIEDIESTM
jgi:hypothetical protein